MKNSNYITIIEDHKKADELGLNLFEKILVVCARAKDLHIENMNYMSSTEGLGYKALIEYAKDKLSPIITDKLSTGIDGDDEDDEESTL